MKKAILFAAFAALALCGCRTAVPEIHDGFELSYWVDMDLLRNNGRGYWQPVESRPANMLPTEQEVANACSALALRYGADKLYVVYHRQFEADEAKQLFGWWKEHGLRHGMKIVPTVVLESYAEPNTTNFTDEEICSLAEWCVANIDPDEFGIYDVYIRQAPGSGQDRQMAVLKSHIGDRLVRVGLQPGEHLNDNCVSGVEDTWTAECQGLTNELWEHPVEFNGSDLHGRKLLEEWVAERAEGEYRRIVWDMIPVAWDYEEPHDPYGYVCPGDDALINDPPIAGRIALCHEYIVKGYPDGMNTPKFGGYSCDLHILEANSAGKPESPSFYEQLRNDLPYEGYFAIAMEQVGDLYKQLQKAKNK